MLPPTRTALHPNPDRLRGYVNGLLSTVEMDEVEAHLGACSDCAAAISDGRATTTRGVASGLARAIADPPGLQVGHHLGRYQIKQRLGAGGMGVVYRAWDSQLARDVALKLLLDDTGARRDTLLREARALAKLTHPNVVAVYDVVDDGALVALAMELVEGTTLATRHAAPLRERLRFLLEAARGLHAIHQAGMVHRDFKPANVLVGHDGRARVADLGLAHLVSASVIAPTAGTRAYMAPEQVAGGAATPASDVYAFCVSAAELLSGLRPGARATPGDRASKGPTTRPALALLGLVKRGRSELPRLRPSMPEVISALERAATAQLRRRQALALIALLALTGAGTFQVTRAQQVCTALHQAAAESWSQDTRAKLTQAGLPEALTRPLEERAQMLASATEETCATTRTPPPAVSGCLFAAAEDLQLATAVALRLSPAAVPDSPRLWSRVAPAANCLSGAQVVRNRLPADAVAAAIEVLRISMETESAAINYRDASPELARQAVRTAEQSHNQWLQAIALVNATRTEADEVQLAERAEVLATGFGAAREAAHAAMWAMRYSCQQQPATCAARLQHAAGLAKPLSDPWLDTWVAEYSTTVPEELATVEARWRALPGASPEGHRTRLHRIDQLNRQKRFTEAIAVALQALEGPDPDPSAQERGVVALILSEAFSATERCSEARHWLEVGKKLAVEPEALFTAEVVLAVCENHPHRVLEMLAGRADRFSQLMRLQALTTAELWPQYDAQVQVLEALQSSGTLTEVDRQLVQYIDLEASTRRGDAARLRKLEALWPKSWLYRLDLEVDVLTEEGREAEARALLRTVGVPDGGPSADLAVSFARRAELALRERRFVDAEHEARSTLSAAATEWGRFAGSRLLSDALLSQGRIKEGCAVSLERWPHMQQAPYERERTQKLRQVCLRKQ